VRGERFGAGVVSPDERWYVARSDGMLELGILGPLEVRRDEAPLPLPGIASRRVLAVLVVARGQWLSADGLVEELWPQRSPAPARKALQMHIVRLRRALGADAGVVQSAGAGYRLDVGSLQIDAARFEYLIEEGQRVLGRDAERARTLLTEALALWRGRPMAEFEPAGSVAAESRRLEELRLAALESRIEADLYVGRHLEIIGELRGLVHAHPSRERFYAQLMLALYRAERQVDALEVYRDARWTLVEQFGVEPTQELRDLERAILQQRPTLTAAPSSRGQPAVGHRTTIPALTRRLIGRQGETDELSRQLTSADVRLVTIVGAGGVGKTRLAREVAAAVQGHFAGGAHWIELAGLARAADVASTIATELGTVPVGGESSEDAVCRALESEDALVVIDNFEHVLDAAPFVSTILRRCASVTVLATSRQALNVSAEHAYMLAPLAVPPIPEHATEDAVRMTPAPALFLDAANRHGHEVQLDDEAARDIASICTRLDGLPLALELAAARLPLFGTAELAARLTEAVSVLGDGPRDAPDRHRTLDATLDWSYELLDPGERSAFAGFAAFAGGATLPAAQEVTRCGLDVLQGLVDKQLLVHQVRQREGRFAMLETVRAYALRRLQDSRDANAVRARHLAHFARVAARRDAALLHDADGAWFARIDRDIGNLRAALAWATQNDPEAALSLASDLGDYWMHKGDAEEGLRWLDGALGAAGPDTHPGRVAKAHSLRSYLLFRTDDLQAAHESAETSLELSRAAADDTLMLHAWGHLVVSAHRRGRREHAEAQARDALRHARRTGNPELVAHALMLLAPSLSSREGVAPYREAVELLTRLGKQRELTLLHGNMATRANIEGRHADALAFAERAVPLTREQGDPFLIQATLGEVGLAELFLGHHDRAEAAFRDQLALCRQHRFRWEAREGLTGMSGIAAIQGDNRRAARLVGAAHGVGTGPPHWADAEVHRRFLEHARSELGDTAWDTEYTAGLRSSFDEALEWAVVHSSREP
jgi:predicted ATPase/DNA-binding SARP family transcriptional activator